MTTDGLGRTVASFAVFCLVVAACITGFSLMVFSWRGWPWALRIVAANVVLTFSIGALCWATLPGVAQRTWHWHPFNRWSALLSTMVGAAAGGTGVGVAIARVLGVGSSAGDLYLDALRTALPVTLIVGIVVTLLESSKARLADTELALRTQQVERERAEKLAAEARLASLAARVQPHFLFNTLNSIASLIREDPARAEQMVERLSSLLRSSLDAARTVPLEHEMKLVTDYLEIQRERLGSRLTFAIDWPAPSINGASVPPFAIQTLVENALKHVAGQRQQGVSLRLDARRDGGELLVEVTDDGPGFDPGALKAGHGLDNLQGRLQTLYGDRAALEFDRAPGAMTVRLRLPV